MERCRTRTCVEDMVVREERGGRRWTAAGDDSMELRGGESARGAD